jgi:hypothetical protein
MNQSDNQPTTMIGSIKLLARPSTIRKAIARTRNWVININEDDTEALWINADYRMKGLRQDEDKILAKLEMALDLALLREEVGEGV